MTAGRRLPRAAPHALQIGFAAAVAGSATLVAARVGPELALGGTLVAVTFGAIVVGFYRVPHIAVATTIPLFATLPIVTTLWNPALGPAKDVVILAALSAVCLQLIVNASAGRHWAGDPVVATCLGLLFALYVLNAGGGHGVAWGHGVRLMFEPFVALVAGLTLRHPRRTLRWAMGSLGISAVAVAAYGIFQQVMGPDRLVAVVGYAYNEDVRVLGGRLRSFGTLDDPFNYATFLLLGLAALIFYRRRAGLGMSLAVSIVAAGIAVSLVRSAALVVLVLATIWLVRHHYTLAAATTLILALAVGAAVLVAATGGSDPTPPAATASPGPLNGRTDSWAEAVGEPSQWLLGRGVGEVGTAAERANSGLIRSASDPGDGSTRAVDSGYVATLADVGLVGLAILLVLLGRLIGRARHDIRAGRPEGWIAAAVLAVVFLDALTRSSFTGFPNAALGFLVVGLSLAAARAPGPS